jgi:hypothetical protein
MATGSALHQFTRVERGIWSDRDHLVFIGRHKGGWIVVVAGSSNTEPYRAKTALQAFNIGRRELADTIKFLKQRETIMNLRKALPADPKELWGDIQAQARVADNDRMREFFAQTKPAPRFKKLTRGLVALVLGR